MNPNPGMDIIWGMPKRLKTKNISSYLDVFYKKLNLIAEAHSYLIVMLFP